VDSTLLAALAGATILILVVLALALRSYARRRSNLRPTEDRPSTDLARRADAPTIERVAPAGLPRGLARTREFLSAGLQALAGREHVGEEDWDDIEEALIRADVGVKVASRLIERLQSREVTPAQLAGELRRALVEILERGDRQFRFNPSGPSVWLIAGVNGTGKTTTIAKLAYHLGQQGRSVALAAADTFRAAAIDQLGEWANRVGVHMVRHAPGADPGAVVFDALQHAKAKSIDVVMVDTAGRLHTKSHLMEELKKIRRIAQREAGEVSEALLILDATVGQNGIAQGRVFGEALQLTGVVLTKLDGTARGGVVVAVQEELRIPVKAVGVGESLADLETFDPEKFVEALLVG
jgi:fused signal recognition particle receptor